MKICTFYYNKIGLLYWCLNFLDPTLSLSRSDSISRDCPFKHNDSPAEKWYFYACFMFDDADNLYLKNIHFYLKVQSL